MVVAQWALARVFPAALAQAEVRAVQVEERVAREAEPVVSKPTVEHSPRRVVWRLKAHLESGKNLTQQLTQYRTQLAGFHRFVQ